MTVYTAIEYRGHVIFRNEYTGMYYTRTSIGDQLAADTLKGIKSLIAELCKKGKE